jgi:hypothetical protein
MWTIVKFSTVDATDSSGKGFAAQRFRFGEPILLVAHAGERGRCVDPGGIAPARADQREHPLAALRGDFMSPCARSASEANHVRVTEAIDADVLEGVARPHRQAPGEIELIAAHQRIRLQRQHGRAQEAVSAFEARVVATAMFTWQSLSARIVSIAWSSGRWTVRRRARLRRLLPLRATLARRRRKRRHRINAEM